jgi:malate/lactate dehydrogenase
LGYDGIEQIIELDLNPEEKAAFAKSALSLKTQWGDASL